MRRAAHEGNKAMFPMYQPLQLREAIYLVDGLLKDQDNWDEELKRCVPTFFF
ncbi:hypothetical protein BDZ89DRAFT_1080844 [Hymenopellis radicata]|nr:hypothetical protein BDZ89DRAFT_1080844 [Hymenopellis radicata]